MDLSKGIYIGRLAGPPTLYPSYDQNGQPLVAINRATGQPRTMRDGTPMLLIRCLYTLLINDAPKKADGTPGVLNRKTVVDFSWPRIRNVLMKFVPTGTQLYIEGRDVTFRKDRGAQFTNPKERYQHVNSVQCQVLKLGARSDKHKNDTHTIFRLALPNGQLQDIQVALTPRREVVRTGAPNGVALAGTFGAMLGGNTVQTPNGVVIPQGVVTQPTGVNPLVSAFGG